MARSPRPDALQNWWPVGVGYLYYPGHGADETSPGPTAKQPTYDHNLHPQPQLDRQLHLGIADDVLRGVYVRGKYRGVILPMTVLRRLDVVLEPTKQAVLERKVWLDKHGIVEQEEPLRQPAGQAFFLRSDIESPLASTQSTDPAVCNAVTGTNSVRRFILRRG